MNNKDQGSGRIARTEVLGLRLTPAEFKELERAASAAGEAVSEYVRKAILLRQQGAPAVPAVNVSVGIYSMQVDYRLSSWASAPDSSTPEEFPDHLEQES